MLRWPAACPQEASFKVVDMHDQNETGIDWLDLAACPSRRTERLGGLGRT